MFKIFFSAFELDLEHLITELEINKSFLLISTLSYCHTAITERADYR